MLEYSEGKLPWCFSQLSAYHIQAWLINAENSILATFATFVVVLFALMMKEWAYIDSGEWPFAFSDGGSYPYRCVS